MLLKHMKVSTVFNVIKSFNIVQVQAHIRVKCFGLIVLQSTKVINNVDIFVLLHFTG